MTRYCYERLRGDALLLYRDTLEYGNNELVFRDSRTTCQVASAISASSTGSSAKLANSWTAGAEALREYTEKREASKRLLEDRARAKKQQEVENAYRDREIALREKLWAALPDAAPPNPRAAGAATSKPESVAFPTFGQWGKDAANNGVTDVGPWYMAGVLDGIDRARGKPSQDLIDTWEDLIRLASASNKSNPAQAAKEARILLCVTRSYPAWLKRGMAPLNFSMLAPEQEAPRPVGGFNFAMLEPAPVPTDAITCNDK